MSVNCSFTTNEKLLLTGVGTSICVVGTTVGLATTDLEINQIACVAIVEFAIGLITAGIIKAKSLARINRQQQVAPQPYNAEIAGRIQNVALTIKP